MKKAPTMSIADLFRTAGELVSNALILKPDVPPEILSDQILDDAEPVFRSEFGRLLMAEHFNRAIRAERAKKRRSLLPAEFAHLPLVIRVPGRKPIRTDKAQATDARRYYFYLGGRHDAQKKNDQRRIEAKRMWDLLRKPARKNKGITAGEVLGFDFGE